MAKVLDQNSEKIKLPIDVAVKSKNGNRKEQDVSELPSEYPIYDIGSKTIMNYIKYIKKAKTIFVIGPLGVYEEENFSKGTFEVFNEIAKSNALSIASGGHTVEALKIFYLVDEFTYTSIAGGAFLEYMMGKKLPGTECLRISAEKNKSC
jgi:phosphoglycerate kinase